MRVWVPETRTGGKWLDKNCTASSDKIVQEADGPRDKKTRILYLFFILLFLLSICSLFFALKMVIIWNQRDIHESSCYLLTSL